MEQYAANDKVEQLSAQRARLRVAEHRRAIEALLTAKREAFEREQVGPVLVLPAVVQWWSNLVPWWSNLNEYVVLAVPQIVGAVSTLQTSKL